MLMMISGLVICLFTTKEGWDVFKQIYSKVKDAILIYDITTKVNTTKQISPFLSEYFNVMKVY